MPDSPVAVNRGTGRTAVGPCEIISPLQSLFTDLVYCCQPDMCMQASWHSAEKPVGTQSQLMRMVTPPTFSSGALTY